MLRQINHCDMLMLWWQNQYRSDGCTSLFHDDVIKWKHFLRKWTFVMGIHRSPVNSHHKGQWCGALTFSLICACANDWANKRHATGYFRRHRAYYVVTVMTVWFVLGPISRRIYEPIIQLSNSKIHVALAWIIMVSYDNSSSAVVTCTIF